MTTHPRLPRAAATVTFLALAAAASTSRADAPAPNADMRYVSVGAQADTQHNQQVLSALSLPVGQHAWVQAGVGQSHEQQPGWRVTPGVGRGGSGQGGHANFASLSATYGW
jgi:hypothetical protein